MLSFLVGSFFIGVSCAASGNTAVAIQAILDPIRDNKTALGLIRAPPWVLPSEIRGTSSILWSCLVTLVACIYTALHLNVPNKQGKWAQLFAKVNWVLSALLAPEVLIYIALNQFLEAQRLRRELRLIAAKAAGISDSSDPPTNSYRQAAAEAGLGSSTNSVPPPIEVTTYYSNKVIYGISNLDFRSST